MYGLIGRRIDVVPDSRGETGVPSGIKLKP